MWFFKQAQQTIPVAQSKEAGKPEPIKPIHNQVEIKTEQSEKKLETTKSASPVQEWFADVVKPLEHKNGQVIEESTEQLFDEKGWWKEE